jgi:hypothetical protein
VTIYVDDDDDDDDDEYKPVWPSGMWDVGDLSGG